MGRVPSHDKTICARDNLKVDCGQDGMCELLLNSTLVAHPTYSNCSKMVNQEDKALKIKSEAK